MNNQSPPPAPPPVDHSIQPHHDPYDFLYKEEKKQKKRLVPRNGSRNQKIVMALIGVLVLLVVGTIVMSFLGQGSKKVTESVVDVVQQQAEIARISAVANTSAKDPSTKSTALTTALSLATNQSKLLDKLKSSGNKLSSSEISASKNEANDKALSTAAQSNNFDSVFMQILNEELAQYAKTLQTALDASQTSGFKKLLEQAQSDLATLQGS